MLDNYQQYSCNSMVSTRLAEIQDGTINDLINLGYIAADLAPLDAIAFALVGVDSASQTEKDELRARLTGRVKGSAPGLLRAPWRVPRRLESCSTQSVLEGLRVVNPHDIGNLPHRGQSA